MFHSEHNRQIDQIKATILASGDVAFLNQWLTTPVTAIPANPATLVWDGERLFQAAKFATEMQYQHLVFEEFARTMQPNVDAFLAPNGFDTTINPAIVAEFAHTIFRLGHSMLVESIDLLAPNFVSNDITLITSGFDHGVGHSLLVLCDAKAPHGKKWNDFKALENYLFIVSISLS